MSPKLNIDEQSQLAEPIELTLDGKDYKVTKVTSNLLDKVTAIGKAEDKTDAPIKQLALLLGVEEKVFKDTDVRKVGKALSFITEEVTRGMEKPKNE